MTTLLQKRTYRVAVVLGAVCLAPGLAARTIVECIDESGQKSFREFCPPGSIKKGEKKVQGKLAPGVDIAAISAKNPVTIYTIPKCDACDLMRLQLQQRGVPFTEKDASTDPAIQDELKALIGAKDNLVKVPVMTVGKAVVSEYKPGDVNATLDEAGYPATGTDSPGAAATATAGAEKGAPDTVGEGSSPAATSSPADTSTKAESVVAQ
jgi:glutaredoxin